ncbi:LMBR1-like membrane protein domain-containing protein [Ditylenchus destructor]|uniref:LMBR1-like membrane protein domain-containing protein n=1 Tax=Ditylenchus destructor TaxID=166010 RepID=A0AAD4MUQ5_9BILA|nr:LMBR1-like membrane protein domain-containing protein [Ditylenchus destructor]
MDDYAGADEALDFQELEFYGFIRKHLICLLLFVFLYLTSFSIIRLLKTRSDNDELYAGDEDFFVYRVSVWMCSCALAVSIGAVTLVPFSVLGSEVLHLYPDNYYLKWLNWSLIHSLWNYVFLLSNISLFLLLPFAYFFIESQGLSWFCNASQPHPIQRPLLARVYETMMVCVLVIILLIALIDVCYSLFWSESASPLISLYVSSLSTPLLYSFVSLLGVGLLLISAPLGFAKMFDLLTSLMRPKPRRVGGSPQSHTGTPDPEESAIFGSPSFSSLATAERLQAMTCIRKQMQQRRRSTSLDHANGHNTSNGTSKNGYTNFAPPRRHQSVESEAKVKRWLMGKIRMSHYLKGVLPFVNALKYPFLMVVLLALTTLSVAMVVINTLQLLFGFRALPAYVQYVEVHSRHRFGIVGALVENTIILYIMFASLVGTYSVPVLRRMRPQRGKTSMTCIIMNCTTVLLLSSALPVLARTLGITSIDLLGAYGSLNWISNFSLIWSYNVLFAAATIFCLVNKFTLPVRKELMRRLCLLTRRRSTLVQSEQNPEMKTEKLE